MAPPDETQCALPPRRSQSRQRRWSPYGAPWLHGGNRRQIEESRKPQKQAKTVAVGCDPLPEKFHGKEGVDGSSPSEGSAKFRQRPSSYRDDFAEFLACVGGDPLWSLQVQSPNPDSRLHSTSFCFRSRRRSGTPPTPASRRRVSRERGSRPRPSPPRVLRPPQLEPTQRRRHRRSLR